jgi:hypothetical protein
VYGGNSGTLWLDDIVIEETALVYVTRDGARTPLKVYDPNNSNTVYLEGTDYNPVSDARMSSTPALFTDTYHTPPTITLPSTTSLTAGQIVAIDSYSAFPVPGSNSLNMCVTSTKVANYLDQNANALATSVMPQGGGLLLQYDEIRQFNSCALCRAKGMTAGQLLGWHAGQSARRYNTSMPNSPLYTWSDMFDPYHNGHDHYFYVEGDFSWSFDGIAGKHNNYELEPRKPDSGCDAG